MTLFLVDVLLAVWDTVRDAVVDFGGRFHRRRYLRRVAEEHPGIWCHEGGLDAWLYNRPEKGR